MSERQTCRLVGQPRGTQRYQPTQGENEDRLMQSILALASKYGRFGYRRITALLKLAGWQVGRSGAAHLVAGRPEASGETEAARPARLATEPLPQFLGLPNVGGEGLAFS